MNKIIYNGVVIYTLNTLVDLLTVKIGLNAGVCVMKLFHFSLFFRCVCLLFMRVHCACYNVNLYNKIGWERNKLAQCMRNRQPLNGKTTKTDLTPNYCSTIDENSCHCYAFVSLFVCVCFIWTHWKMVNVHSRRYGIWKHEWHGAKHIV